MVKTFRWQAGALLAVAAGLLVGCDTDDQVTGERADAKALPAGTIAFGSGVATCDESIPTGARVGGTDKPRVFISTEQFGMLQSRFGFKPAHPAETALGAEFAGQLIANTPATVLGSGSVTVTVPPGARDQTGLVFGSLSRYEHPLAELTFEPCDGDNATSWTGGLVLTGRRPVTLLVTEGRDDAVRRLRIGARVPASVPVANGSHVARCRTAMLGNMRISQARLGREYNAVGRFALLESPEAFAHAQPAGGLLESRFQDVLLTKIPATVLGTGPVTLTVPVGSRGRAGLLYGSLSGYREPYSKVTFIPCRHRAGTSWPGGIALLSRRPVSLRVTTAGGDRIWWLRVGA